jgi:FAD/FMN-containing dehydrogenase
LPMDFGARGSATVGGVVATNAGGNRVIRYGMAREVVLGLEVVLADGTVVTSLNKMLKNNTGYDIKQWFIGAEGTLGVVTRVVLRLRPSPRSQCTALLAVERLRLGHRAAEPCQTAARWHAERLRGDVERLLQRRHHAAGTAPAAAAGPFSVLCADRGARQRSAAGPSALRAGDERGTGVGADQALRDDVAQLGRYYPLTGFDISLPLEAMEAYLSAVEQRLKADWEQTRLIIFGHLGDGNLHLAVSLRADSSEERQRVEEIVYSELASRNGSISAEHGIGLQKKAYLHHCRSADEVALMRRIKQALDDERRGEPGPDPGQQWRGRGLFRQPRHLGDALRRRARPRAGHALRARPVRRRSWPARPTAMRAWPASRPATLLHCGPGLGNAIANLHNAKARAHAGGQHRRRPRDLPQVSTTRR